MGDVLILGVGLVLLIALAGILYELVGMIRDGRR